MPGTGSQLLFTQQAGNLRQWVSILDILPTSRLQPADYLAVRGRDQKQLILPESGFAPLLRWSAAFLKLGMSVLLLPSLPSASSCGRLGSGTSPSAGPRLWLLVSTWFGQLAGVRATVVTTQDRSVLMLQTVKTPQPSFLSRSSKAEHAGIRSLCRGECGHHGRQDDERGWPGGRDCSVTRYHPKDMAPSDLLPLSAFAAMRVSPSFLAGAAPQAAADTSENATVAKKLNSSEKILLHLLIVCVSTCTWHGI